MTNEEQSLIKTKQSQKQDKFQSLSG